MKIAVIGATGMAGSALVQEALNRGHEVTAISRTQAKLAQLAKDSQNVNLKIVAQDAFALMQADLMQYDVVIDAFACAPDQAYLHVDLATHLIAETRQLTKPRLVFILGAGSLLTGSDQHLFVRDMEKDPANQAFISVPQNQLSELQFLRTVDNVDWVGISPGVNFVAGAATELQLGQDELLFNQQEVSQTTAGTMAVAALDEIEQPQHQQERFTVINR